MRYLSLIGPLCGLYVPLPDGVTRDNICRSMLRDVAGNIYPESEVDALGAVTLGTPIVKLPDYFAACVFDGGPLPPLMVQRGRRDYVESDDRPAEAQHAP